MHFISIDKGSCEAEMYHFSSAIIVNVSTNFLETSSLFIGKSYHYFYFCFLLKLCQTLRIILYLFCNMICYTLSL